MLSLLKQTHMAQNVNNSNYEFFNNNLNNGRMNVGNKMNKRTDYETSQLLKMSSDELREGGMKYKELIEARERNDIFKEMTS